MNKSIDEYTIYCTPEQTKKAFELGASILRIGQITNTCTNYCKLFNKITISNIGYHIPTAEQMIGWLEEQDILIDIHPINGLHFYWMLSTKELDEGSGRYMWECQYITPERDLEYNSRQEATIASIDAALEYLSNKKSK